MTDTREWSLSQVSSLLGETQAKLIHFCEERVIIPDFADASGRGSSRRFSARNILQFAIAVRLSSIKMPLAAIAAVNHVLSQFEKEMRGTKQHFELPDSLRTPSAIDLRVIIRDGRLLYFAIHGQREAKIFGGVDILALALSHLDPPVFHRENLRALVRLVESFQKRKDPLATFLNKTIPQDLQRKLLQFGASRIAPGVSQSQLVNEFNQHVLTRKLLYSKERVPHLVMPEVIKQLMESSPRSEQIVFLNRWLLHESFSRELGKSRRLAEWRDILDSRTPDGVSRVIGGDKHRADNFGGLEGSRYLRMELSITNIAKDLPI